MGMVGWAQPGATASRRRGEAWRAARAVGLIAGAVVGCSGGGGSSRPPIVDPCQQPPASTADPQAALVLAAAQGHHNVDGTWLNGRQPAVLGVDVEVGATPLPGSGTGCGSALLLEATVTVRTRDAVIEGQAQVLRFDDYWSAWVEVPLADLADAYARPAPKFGSIPDGPNVYLPQQRPSAPAPTLVLVFSASSLRANLFVDGRVVGTWSALPAEVPWRWAGPHTLPAELVADCAPANDLAGQEDAYTAFASAGLAAAAMPGTWIHCQASGPARHAGIQISPDGTWRTLAWRDGGFVTQGGFQQEGAVEEPIDVSAYNGPGYFQINLSGPRVWFATHLWGDRLVGTAVDTTPLDRHHTVYVRTDRAVETASNPYTSRQRAGAAACAQPETGVVELGLGSELESTLAGEWTLCAGELLDGYVGLRFDGQGAVTLLAAGGETLRRESYRAIQPETMPNPTPYRKFLLFDGSETSWEIMLSDRPLKLWMVEQGPHTTDRKAVFSAVP
jgi:hypothetical protein